MNNTKITSSPRLLFFCGTLPSGWESKPGLCASLQHLDSAFLLVGVGRFPHAVVSCAAAVESVIVEALPTSAGDDFEALVHRAAVRWAVPDPLREGVLSMKTRCDGIVHAGYSPQDDRGPASVLVHGLQFLELVYRIEHAFEVRRSLLPYLREHLNVAEQLSKSLPNDTDATVAWHSFAHAVRWSVSDSFMSPWDLDARDARRCGNLDWPFDPQHGGDIRLACPICGSDQACELEFDGEEDPVVWVDRMECKECGFWLSPDQRAISERLFSRQLENERPRILKEYGFACAS